MYKKQWGFLKNKYEMGQLGHAYLIAGHNQKEIFEFAKEFVKFLNCDGNDKPCQKCANCRMIERGGYPDLFIVKKDKEKDEVSISKIREVQNFLAYKSYYGGYKAVIISEAEKMNLQAQNCFLKTLEEPKGKTIIFMVSESPDLLLTTISSRCQTVKFFKVRSSSENNGNLIKNLLPVINSDLAEKFRYTKGVDLEGGKFSEIIYAFQNYFRELLFVKIGISGNNGIRDQDSYSMEKIKKILRLIDFISLQNSRNNLNQKLALEIILLEI